MKEMKHNENPSLVKSKLNHISRFRARLDIDIVVLQLDSSDEQAAAIRRELDARREKITEMERVSVSASKSSIRRVVITEKAPTRAFSWLKAATTAFTFKKLC